jgi:cell division protease FtsH
MNAMNKRDRGGPPDSGTDGKPAPSRRLNILWLLLFLALMLWNVWLFLPKAPAQVEIPYSTFLDQAQGNNVSDVTINSSEITGTLKQSIMWPSPTALAPTPQATASAGTELATQPAATPQQVTDFKTYFPTDVGDPRLIALLSEHQVTVNVQAPSSPWLALILSNGLPLLLLVALFVWMGRQASQSQSGIFNFGRSKARHTTGERTEVTFDDVAGADEAKTDLKEVVDFLRHPAKYHDLGARIPRGVLLVGPPGTGKTLMARAVAGEAGVPFFNLSASEFVEMFVGVGASRVRDLFEQAKAAAPAIIFIDELDAVGRRRGAGMGAVNDEREQTLNQLLVEMDGFDERHEVILLAATNRPDVLDPALQRPGRFDRQVVVGMPDRKGREGILQIHTRNLHLGPKVDLGLLAKTTTGLNGADLANLCNEAALVAARLNHEAVGMEDFEEAIDKILLGGVRPLLLEAHERKVVAYHESGHALIAWLTEDADPVHKVTIIPRGRALGVTEQVPGEEHYNYSRSYLMARLAVMLGGRGAEEIAMGDITTGAENDLVEATRLARRMVTRWAMGELGQVAFAADEEQPFLGYELTKGRDYSETTASQIDKNIQALLTERHEYVLKTLSQARDKLDKLAQGLLDEETVDQTGLARILGERPEGSAGEGAPAALASTVVDDRPSNGSDQE